MWFCGPWDIGMLSGPPAHPKSAFVPLEHHKNSKRPPSIFKIKLRSAAGGGP